MKKEAYYVINSDQEVRKVYYHSRQISKCIKEKEKEGFLLLPGFSNLVCDIFCSLYMINPKVKTLDEIDTKYFINMVILEGLLVDPSYQTIKEKTNFSKVTALWVTELFVDKLLKSLKREKRNISHFHKKNTDLNKEIIKKSLEEKKTGFFLIWFHFLKIYLLSIIKKKGRLKY
ncbi:MAG: hypothetical protein ABII25_02270 [bacterium]